MIILLGEVEPVGYLAERHFGQMFLEKIRDLQPGITNEEILKNLPAIEMVLQVYFDLTMMITQDLSQHDGLSLDESVEAMDRVFDLTSGYAANHWLRARA